MLSAWVLLLSRIVEGRTVAVRPFRVLRATLPKLLDMTDHAASPRRKARALSFLINRQRPTLTVSNLPSLIRS